MLKHCYHLQKGNYEMTWEVRFLVTLFAIMFFWIATTEAFAQQTMQCWKEGSITRCIDVKTGNIVTIINS